jgi:hypothetical protein
LLALRDSPSPLRSVSLPSADLLSLQHSAFSLPPAGWWSIYLALLHGGGTAPVAAFYDPAQRPAFRDRERFAIENLAAMLSQPAHARLPRAVRYTRPVYDYLRSLILPDGTGPGSRLAPAIDLREGPPVELLCASPERTAAVAGELVQRWVSQGLCRPHEVLILGLRRERTLSSLGATERLGKYSLCEYTLTPQPETIPYLNIHRAKGLDRLAIIIIDLPPWETLAASGDPNLQETLFAAASRARQMLGVIALASE